MTTLGRLAERALGAILSTAGLGAIILLSLMGSDAVRRPGAWNLVAGLVAVAVGVAVGALLFHCGSSLWRRS